jgi:hypothetical protein
MRTSNVANTELIERENLRQHEGDCLPKRRESTPKRCVTLQDTSSYRQCSLENVECRKYRINRKRELGRRREDGRVSWRRNLLCSVLVVLVVQSGLSVVSCAEWTERSELCRVD